MARPRCTISVSKAVMVGTLAVNIPVFALLLGPGFFASKMGWNSAVPYVFGIGFVLAWAWWSFSAPRWRLWSYERVESTSALHRAGIAAGLLWPKGSALERTEISSPQQRARRQELEHEFP